MSQTIPTFSEIQPLATSTLVRWPYFVTASNGIDFKNPGTDDRSLVIQHTGFQKPIIERHLINKGACVSIQPLLGAILRDQSGTAWLTDMDLLIKVMINPERNANTKEGGAGLNIYEMVWNVIQALKTSPRHPGGEFFKLGKEVITLSQFDEGIWVYNVQFTKEGML